MPFKKGQSGNPTGRKRKTAEAMNVEETARKLAPEALERLAYWMRQDNPRASSGASNAILDRAYGKPAQAITGADGGPLTVVVRKFSDA